MFNLTGLKEVLEKYNLDKNIVELSEFGYGRINKTIKLTTQDKGQNQSYILQKINQESFLDIEGLMKNIVSITDFLKTKVRQSGGDADREVLTVIKGKTGNIFERDEKGGYYRIYKFITNSLCHQSPQNPEMFEECGRGFGRFQKQLVDFDPSLLVETIVDFHNTQKRFENFEKVYKLNLYERAESSQSLIDFILSRTKYNDLIMSKIKEGVLPIRVTHNDTKLNNMLFDDKTKKALVVLDLDTVMPGPVCNDFGDAVRFGCNTAREDEKDLSKVNFNYPLFKAYARGYLSETKSFLSFEEIASLVDGCLVLTYELGLRFLTDYLNNDKYFSTSYESENLQRARVQFKLLEKLELYEEKMRKYVDLLAKDYNLSEKNKIEPQTNCGDIIKNLKEKNLKSDILNVNESFKKDCQNLDEFFKKMNSENFDSEYSDKPNNILQNLELKSNNLDQNNKDFIQNTQIDLPSVSQEIDQ